MYARGVGVGGKYMFKAIAIAVVDVVVVVGFLVVVDGIFVFVG